MSEATRGWIYRALVVVGLVAGILGFVTEDQVTAIISTVGLLFGAGLATANTSVTRSTRRPVEGPPRDA